MRITGSPTRKFLIELVENTDCNDYELKAGTLLELVGDVKVTVPLSALPADFYLHFDKQSLSTILVITNNSSRNIISNNDNIMLLNSKTQDGVYRDDYQALDDKQYGDNTEASIDPIDSAIREFLARAPDRKIDGKLFSEVCAKHGVDRHMISDISNRLAALDFKSINGKPIYPAILRSYLRYKGGKSGAAFGRTHYMRVVDATKQQGHNGHKEG